jgi:hypothetical protein
MVILIVFVFWASVATITYWFDDSDDAKKPTKTSTPRVVAGDVSYPPIQIVWWGRIRQHCVGGGGGECRVSLLTSHPIYFD